MAIERESHAVTVDRWTPNWKKRCIVCGDKGTVNGMQGYKVVYNGDMCGVCTWGEAAMANPDNWNK